MRVSSASSPLGTAGKERAGLLGCPHPAFGHPLPEGEGYDSYPSYPLSLWERVGVRVSGASSPLGTAGKERAGLLGCPHPAFGHPLPEGEGYDSYPSYTLSLWERVGVRVSSASSPLGTAGKERAGLLGRPHPAFGHPLPKGEGYDSQPSYPLSLWERVGVRVSGASSPLGTAGKERAGLLGRPHPAFGHPLPEGEGYDSQPSYTLSLWERVGVRVSSASSPLGTAGKEPAGLLGRPHPAFGHPLPEGEGYDSYPSYTLSLWERVGVRVSGASSPLGTAGKERAGLLGCPHPAFGHPLPEGEGYDSIPLTPSPSGRGLG